MLFTAYQIIVMLREIMSAEDIRAAGGPVREVQQRILKKPDYNVKDMLSLMMILVRHKLLPFDEFWIQPLMRLYELEERSEIVSIEREFAALYEMAARVIEANLVTVASPTRKGALFFAAKYLGAFAKAKSKKYVEAKPAALKKSSEYYQTLIDEMRIDRDSCSLLIKGIAAANLVVNHWNATTPAERNSKEMREYIRRSGYLVWAAKQMRKWTLIAKPAFNSLALASTHRRRRYYPILRRALERALENAHADFRKYPEFADEDFDDFRAWELDNPPKNPKPKGEKKSKIEKQLGPERSDARGR
jgi:hypothetical protein